MNPRTPTRQGPKPCSFDQTGRPPPSSLLRIESTLSAFNILLKMGMRFSIFGDYNLTVKWLTIFEEKAILVRLTIANFKPKRKTGFKRENLSENLDEIISARDRKLFIS